jgi:hypothetical protein
VTCHCFRLPLPLDGSVAQPCPKVNCNMPTVIQLSDAEIDALIREAKTTPAGLSPLNKLTERFKHKGRTFEVTSTSGNEFVVIVRQSMLNMMDFSAILGYKMPGFNTIFRLRRYNGKHPHTNEIERSKLNDFHVHTATERYQQLGARHDSYAEVSSRHWSLSSAIDCLIEDCGFDVPPSNQIPLPLPRPTP